MNKFLFLIALVMSLTACSNDEKKSETVKEEVNNEKLWTVGAQKTSLITAQPTVQLLGTVESYAQSNIVAKVAGDVKSVSVKAGDRVLVDTILIELDTTELDLAVEQAQAQLAQAEAAIANQKSTNKLNRQLRDAAEEQYKLAQSQFERMSALAEKRNVSERTLDEQRQALLSQQDAYEQRSTMVESASATMNSLEAQRKSAEIALKIARLNQSYATIKAPFNAVITDVSTAVGSRVQNGQTVVSAFSTDSIEVRVSVPEQLTSWLRQSTDTAIKATSAATEFELDRIGATVSASGAGTEAYFKPLNHSDELILGKSISLTVYLPESDDVTALPTSAIHGTNRVFLIEDVEGVSRLKGVDVTIVGQRNTSGKAEVLIQSPDIPAGTLVLTTPLPAAVNGLAVQVAQ